ncbi:MAG: insulinase family protein [Bacteroidales bacterium]|nr:insulinase family protein [Bacteroidales bacterium]
MRIKIYLILSLLLGLFLQPLSGQNIEEYKLENGLSVYLNEDHNTPEVFGMVVTKAGSKNDPADATGMAHYQEHILFKGTTKLGTTNWEKEKEHIDKIFELYDKLGKTIDEEERKSIQKLINEESVKANEYAIPNEFSNVLNSMGSKNINAGTGPDQTVFYNSFPPNQIEKWLELNAHRMKEPVFRGFQSELEVVYEEKNMYSDQFMTNLIEEFQKNFFKNHPYGQQTTIGTIDDLKNPSLTKMYEFFKTYYVANNMALILCGNFDSETVKPLIDKTFGKLESGNVPEPKVWEEKPFNGRELVEAKLSPIKIGLLGFRTVTNGHPDKIALDVAQNILSNQNQSGLLDKLAIDNKLMFAGVIPLPYNDHGATLVFFVPKIVGQKLISAEELVLEQLQNLKDGNFDDWKIEAAKKDLYVKYQQSIENPKRKANLISDVFIRNEDLEEIFNYPEKTKAITKQDVIDVANKYFGNSFLAFHSKMGFSKPEKIDKPGYEPVISNTDAKSEFAQYLESLPFIPVEPDYVDFEKDVITKEIKEYIHLYHVNNPVNDIFSLEIKFGAGKIEIPLLDYAGEIMNYAGTKTKSVSELKQEFSKIGCSYSIYSDDNFTTISMEGMEESLQEALILINDLINNSALEENKLNNILENAKANRKMEKSEADGVADALFEYVKYGNNSDYIDRLTLKEIKKLTTNQLLDAFNQATHFETEIHYVGQKDAEIVAQAISNTLIFGDKLNKTKSPLDREINQYQENIVYLVNKKKALQSKIYFFANQDNYKPESQAYIDAFKMYFSGGFSGLVLQEIREYRSLAYSAGASIRTPQNINGQSYFVGYIGTQADKTLIALETFMGLVREMPEKSDRMPMIKDYLVQSSIIDKPNYRNLSSSVLSWKRKGFNDDPAKVKSEIYQKLNFSDIVNYNNNNLKNQAMVIAIVGDKKRIDLEELKKYGKIIEIKEKELFKD